MPFDGTLNEADQLVSLDKPSLRGLAYALRHQETWPAEFVWDYRDSFSCAMGLSARIWREIEGPFFSSVCRGMRIKGDEKIDDVFYKQARIRGFSDMRAVTPKHVADAIDAYLAPQA